MIIKMKGEFCSRLPIIQLMNMFPLVILCGYGVRQSEPVNFLREVGKHLVLSKNLGPWGLLRIRNSFAVAVLKYSVSPAPIQCARLFVDSPWEEPLPFPRSNEE